MSRSAQALALSLMVSGCMLPPPDHPPIADPTADSSPPAPLPEVAIDSPWPGGIWLQGFWSWDGSRYVWMPGKWERPHDGWSWQPHRWVRRGRHWRFVPGRWVAER
jgi:hypothetical protein